MKLNYHLRRLLCASLILVCFVSLSGCGQAREVRLYSQYVKNLIAMNYLGANDEYISATGTDRESANAIYDGNISYLTNNILSYYNLHIENAPEMRAQYEELAKKIYSRINYKVSDAYKYGSAYLVDVTVYPINLFYQTSPDVRAYVEKFNADVAMGVYNDYTMGEYEAAFASGLYDILSDACDVMAYADPVTLTVEIVEDEDSFYLRDRDFMDIDACMINTEVPD